MELLKNMTQDEQTRSRIAKGNSEVQRIENEIREFENRILSTKREIDNVEALIEINAYYSDKNTDNFFYVNI